MPNSAADTVSPPPAGAADGTTVHVDRSWWSWNGAQGGYVAALALTAMRDERAARGQGELPVRALSAHFLAPVDERPLHFSAFALREGRRTSMSSVTAVQGGVPALTGSAVFGRTGHGPVYDGIPAPDVPRPEACPVLALPSSLAAFAARLEIRPATGARPLGGGQQAELLAWMRFADHRPLDAETTVVLADALPPALFALWTEARPVPTAELTVHFTDALDARPADSWALVRIRTEHAGGGWGVDDSTIWSGDGRLLALARQSRTIPDGLSAKHPR